MSGFLALYLALCAAAVAVYVLGIVIHIAWILAISAAFEEAFAPKEED